MLKVADSLTGTMGKEGTAQCRTVFAEHDRFVLSDALPNFWRSRTPLPREPPDSVVLLEAWWGGLQTFIAPILIRMPE